MSTRNGLIELRREMDRLFDDLWSAPAAREWENADRALTPACDVQEADEHYLLSLDLPGVPQDAIKIESFGNQLTVSAERKQDERKQGQGYRYRERRYGRFERSFTLPQGVDSAKVEANYQDGVLHVLVPKAESAKPRQIPVSNGTGSGGFFAKLIKNEKSA